MGEAIDPGEFGDGFRTDPHPLYARLRACGPVHRVRLRTPGLAPAGPPGDRLPGMLLRGVRSLPVRW
jgi:hypothetical protein